MAINLKVNGVNRSVPAEPDTPLLYVLRNDFELNGAKYGCGLSQCGACTVLVDGRAVDSCLVLAVELDGCAITTIEGIADGNRLDPLQEAFLEAGAVQCGFCIPGMIVAGRALISENPRPTPAEVAEAMSGNLCRCGGYTRIVEAVLAVASNGGS